MTEAAEPPNYTMDEFRAAIGEAFATQAGDRTVPLRLEAVEPLSDSGRPGGSFSLIFLGPADLLLSQGIHGFRRGGQSYDIFIVPISRDQDGFRYESVFF